MTKKLQLNKEFITSLDKFEMTHVRGGEAGNGNGVVTDVGDTADTGIQYGFKDWVTAWVSAGAAAVTSAATPTTVVAGTICGGMAAGDLSESGCNSSICGS